ncbi:MAG: ATP-binding protein [Thermoguttaceae bacterium]|jgi:NAD-dependent dihydropyrimidine dehydrogenase PreA subunit
MPENISVILSEPRPDDAGVQALADSLAGRLAGRPGLSLTRVPNLYDLEPGGPVMESIRRLEGDLVVLSALYPRATFWTLKTAGVSGCLGERGESDERAIWCLRLHSGADAGEILGQIDRIASRAHAAATAPAPGGQPVRPSAPARQRWYPVIDRQRCSGCLECLNFCLFGVYGVDAAGGLLIEQPDACRAGCPACSRICPEGAIMFPQHVDPAIAGDDKASLEGLKLDLSQLFAGADPSVMAAAERDRALAEASANGDSERGDQLDDLVDEMDEMDL